MALAESRANIVVLYAIGDASGPLTGEVRIGVSKRRAYQSDVISRMKNFRSRPIAIHVEAYIRGEAAAARLLTAVRNRLADLGVEDHEHGWFRASEIIAGIVAESSKIEGVRTMNVEEAIEIERSEYHKIMDKIAGV